MAPPSLQVRLEAMAFGDRTQVNPAPRNTPDDSALAYPLAAIRRLEASGWFHRDTGFGRILHPGSASFRENRPTDSLHIVVHDNRVTAHVDRVSPLVPGPSGPTTGPTSPALYSLRRAALHNLAGMAEDAVSILRGRKGDHRCELDCEWVWDPDASPAALIDPTDLLDPAETGWSLQLEARLSGRVDEELLRRALGSALGRRPAEHGLLEVTDTPDDGSLSEARMRLHTQPVPVGEWPPLRTTLAHHPEGDVLLIGLNHAAGDGPAALAVLRAIAMAYASLAGGGDAPPEAAPRPDFVAVSDLPVRPASAPVADLAARFRRVVEQARNRLADPAQLAPDQGVDEPGSGFHLVRLTVEETRRVINASRPGTGRNLLLTGLHLAIGEWNAQHGTPGHRIGVLLPVDLRPPGWPEETIGNFSVTARVLTSPRHRVGPRTALAAVRTQKVRNKRVRTGTALIDGLARSGLLPLWAKQSLVVLQPLTRNRMVDAALFADLGWIDEPPSFGDGLDVSELWFSTPARTPDCLCIGTVTVAGRLHVTIRYPRRLFSADAARRFADGYLAQIRLVAETR